MTSDIPVTPELRADAARNLIERAQRDGGVRLTALSAIDLCALGGPKHPYFDEATARAWLHLSDRHRQQAIDASTGDLLKRGLLNENSGGAGAPTYSLSPELGVVLAARARPGFIITNEVSGARFFQPALFALGDASEPVRGIVVESPAGITKANLHDPLSAHYAYALLSILAAAQFLGEWTLRPIHPAQGVPADAARVVTCYHPQDGEGRIGRRISIHTNGTIAQVSCGDDQPATDYDAAGLQNVMLSLIAGQPG